MSNSNESLVFLTVRGKLVAKTPEAACPIHNATAGSAEGIAAARALGDLSHKVYGAVPGMGADGDELLFLDWWKTAEGIGKFFGEAHVQAMAAQLFTDRDAAMWMPARGAFGFDLPAAMSKNDRYVGLVRGPVSSPEHAIEVFSTILAPKLSDARRRDQLSHRLFVRIPMPGDAGAPEILGADLWSDPAGMGEHYQTIAGYEKAFTAPPRTSVWKAPTGAVWSEW